MAKSKTSTLEAKKRRERILQFKLSGLRQSAIADQEGISPAAVSKIVKKINEELDSGNDEMANEMRVLENARLDRLTQTLWPNALRGAKTPIDQVIKIMERRAKMNGLDMPTKIASTTPDGEESIGMSEQEMDARISELLGKMNDDG